MINILLDFPPSLFNLKRSSSLLLLFPFIDFIIIWKNSISNPDFCIYKYPAFYLVALHLNNMASSQPALALESSDSFQFSVQELIKNPKITVPNCYLRLDEEPPNFLNGNFHSTSIPTVDLESLVSKEDPDFDQLEIFHAVCKEWGIFQLVNHGVRSSLMDSLKHEILEFYKLPIEEKMKYKIKPGEVQGYGSLPRSDGKLDWGDRLYIITNPIHKRKPHLLPEFPSSLKNTLESYFLELQNLGMKLLRVIAKALKMEVKEVEETFEDGMQSVRITYYPPCPQPELVMGLTPHSDATGITILNQVNGVDGFEIKKDGVWIPVKIIPDALVVNVGDILEIMSNGVYRSIEHRATVNSEKERISMAFFINPQFDAEIGPATSLINPENPPLFKRMGMDDYVNGFFSRKLNGKSYLEYMKTENGEGNNTVNANN